MQACVDWVLIIFGTQIIKKKRPVRSVFPDYLSVSYDYGQIKINSLRNKFEQLRDFRKDKLDILLINLIRPK